MKAGSGTAARKTRRKGAEGMGCMGSLACTGDGPLPFIVAGVVLVAAAVLVVAFVLMRRNR